MSVLETLHEAIKNPNVQAFLRVIREGETSQKEDAYRTIVGGGKFDSFADHPRKFVRIASLGVTSSAAGAYQFLSRTWDECVKALDLTDFSPDKQDLAALYLIRRRGALNDVIEGRLADAIAKCAREWASLPGSPYGQPTKSWTQALSVYEKWGGKHAPVAPAQPAATPLAVAAPEATAPEEPTVTTYDSPDWPPFAGPTQAPAPTPAPVAQEKPMVAPLIGMFGKAALSAVIDAVPELLKKYSSGSAAAERNIGAASVILDVAKTSIQAANEQELAEKVANDPVAREAVRSAVRDRWYDIEVAEAGGGGIAAARKADAEFTKPDGARFWHSPAFWISILLMIYPTMLLVDVFWVNPERYDGNIRTQIVTGVLAVIMLVGAYWLGTSASSARKTDILARKE